MAALGGVGRGADELEVGDGLPGLQDAFQRGGQPVGLGARQVVLHRAAPVVLGRAAEDGGEALVRPHDGEVGAEQHEAEGRLTEYGL